MDTDTVADELYGLLPKDFTAARDRWVKQARADGDRAAAADIAALRRPTVVAWLANQLARRHRDEIGSLLELGAELRSATATLSGPELRRLSSQRRALVRALVQQARDLGAEAGQRVPEGVARGLEDTLNAALADPGAAQRLVEARLTDGMAHHGYGGPVTEAQQPVPSRPHAADGPAEDDPRRAELRAGLELELGEAWAAARRAADQREQAATGADRAARARSDAEREVTRLRAELTAAESDLDGAEREHEAARASRDLTDLRADRARQRVTELQSRLDGL